MLARIIISTVCCAGLALAAVSSAAASDPYAGAPAYAKPVDGRAVIRPLVTVGQQIPLTNSAPGETYRLPGIPDGIGLYAVPRQKPPRLVLLVNHELARDAGGAAGLLPAGARVSELLFDFSRGRIETLGIVSGRPAIQRVLLDGVPARLDTMRTGLANLCSSTLAWREAGFDRPILFLGEETRAERTFDGRGGRALALIDGDAHTIARLGRAEWENVVAMPFTKGKTVLLGLEDGPSDGDAMHSQIHLYVGDKVAKAANPMTRHGLDNGSAYVFVAEDPALRSENDFATKGVTIAGRWAAVDWTLDDAAYDAAAKAAGAFGFARVEDGVADPKRPGVSYFATTGKRGGRNPLGRLYRLEFDVRDPLRGARLTILLDGSEGVIAPDNVGMNVHGEIAIQEDPGFDMREIGVERDASIWMYEIRSRRLTRIAEVDRAAATRHALDADPRNAIVPERDAPGEWETSGIVDAEKHLGRGAWIFDVEAHGLRIAPVEETVQGGQILSLVWRP